ncbi:adenylyl-sulfate kinase [Fulvivirga sediminis]|uniref:Adenylyl-sulfate kinase n=1 Tax=Fulvivirga sediminis TaxID=2803949 RepID=A0A937F6E4_9BACT|nr:adenylyl-sulfate kinase [Fulvivirga sediminis]MBL3654843.1 adenylyl-sulfate kinase [Fulvivirga sediminis]
MADNIHPIFDTILSTSEKEELLNQKSIVIWMVGLSGSGKSTIARGLENKLHKEGFLTSLLDGDNLRTGLNNNLGFSEEDRTENIRRAAEASKLLAANGVITICSLISPTESIREMAKTILGDKYCEVFINCPIEECEKRDVKGLYAKARKGEIKNFTGIDSPFEAPQKPNITLYTAEYSVEDNLDQLLEYILPKIKPSKN